METFATKDDLKALENRLLQSNQLLLKEIRKLVILSQTTPGASRTLEATTASTADYPSDRDSNPGAPQSSHLSDAASDPVLHGTFVPGHVRALQQSFGFLLREMDVTEDFLDDLVHTDPHVLSESEIESVKDAGLERKTEKRRRVIRFLQKKSEEVFVSHFLPLLRKYQNHVADKLEQAYRECKQAEPKFECISCQTERQIELRHVADAFHSEGHINIKLHEFLTCSSVPAPKRWRVIHTFLESEIWGDDLMTILINIVAEKNQSLAAELKRLHTTKSDVWACTCSVSHLLTDPFPSEVKVQNWLTHNTTHISAVEYPDDTTTKAKDGRNSALLKSFSMSPSSPDRERPMSARIKERRKRDESHNLLLASRVLSMRMGLLENRGEPPPNSEGSRMDAPTIQVTYQRSPSGQQNEEQAQNELTSQSTPPVPSGNMQQQALPKSGRMNRQMLTGEEAKEKTSSSAMNSPMRPDVPISKLGRLSEFPSSSFLQRNQAGWLVSRESCRPRRSLRFERKDTQIDRHTDGASTHKQAEGQTVNETEKQTEKQAKRQTDRQMQIQLDKDEGKAIEGYTYQTDTLAQKHVREKPSQTLKKRDEVDKILASETFLGISPRVTINQESYSAVNTARPARKQVRQTEGQTVKETEKQIEKQNERQTDRQMQIQLDKDTDKEVDRHMEKQTDTLAQKHVREKPSETLMKRDETDKILESERDLIIFT